MVDWVIGLCLPILIRLHPVWVFIRVWIIVGIGIILIIIIQRASFELPCWVDNIEDKAHLVLVVYSPRIFQSRGDNVENWPNNLVRISSVLVLVRIGGICIIVIIA